METGEPVVFCPVRQLTGTSNISDEDNLVRLLAGLG